MSERMPLPLPKPDAHEMHPQLEAFQEQFQPERADGRLTPIERLAAEAFHQQLAEGDISAELNEHLELSRGEKGQYKPGAEHTADQDEVDEGAIAHLEKLIAKDDRRKEGEELLAQAKTRAEKLAAESDEYRRNKRLAAFQAKHGIGEEKDTVVHKPAVTKTEFDPALDGSYKDWLSLTPGERAIARRERNQSDTANADADSAFDWDIPPFVKSKNHARLSDDFKIAPVLKGGSAKEAEKSQAEKLTPGEERQRLIDEGKAAHEAGLALADYTNDELLGRGHLLSDQLVAAKLESNSDLEGAPDLDAVDAYEAVLNEAARRLKYDEKQTEKYISDAFNRIKIRIEEAQKANTPMARLRNRFTELAGTLHRGPEKGSRLYKALDFLGFIEKPNRRNQKVGVAAVVAADVQVDPRNDNETKKKMSTASKVAIGVGAFAALTGGLFWANQIDNPVDRSEETEEASDTAPDAEATVAEATPTTTELSSEEAVNDDATDTETEPEASTPTPAPTAQTTQPTEAAAGQVEQIGVLETAGDTIWNDARLHLIDQGNNNPNVEQVLHEAQRILALNGLTWEEAEKLPVDYQFRV